MAKRKLWTISKDSFLRFNKQTIALLAINEEIDRPRVYSQIWLINNEDYIVDIYLIEPNEVDEVATYIRKNFKKHYKWILKTYVEIDNPEKDEHIIGEILRKILE